MVHSFSITENFAVIFYYPVTLETGTCLIINNFHGMECLKILEDQLTDIFIINLKTKESYEIAAETLFSIHHINAYEINDGSEIVLDMCTNDPSFLKEYTLMTNILNPPQFSNGSINLSNEIIRYTINIENQKLTSSRFPNVMSGTNRRYVNNFDLPTINEDYRGRKVII